MKKSNIKERDEMCILLRKNNKLNKKETPITHDDLVNFGMTDFTSAYHGNLNKNWYVFSISTGFRIYMNKYTNVIHLSNDDSDILGKVYSTEQLALKLIRRDHMESCDFSYKNNVLKIWNSWNEK